jgi:hypothetical protein
MNLFTKRIGLLLSAVVGVGAIAALSIGASFSLFSATQPGGSQTFTAGTVSMYAPTSATCNTTVGTMEPGDSGTCYFSVSYGGSLPAYIGATATVTSQTPGSGGGNLADVLSFQINGIAQTSSNPVLIGNSTTGAPYTADVVYTLSSSAGDSYQGSSATVTVTFHAVQCSNNGANADGSLSPDANESCSAAQPASWTQTPGGSYGALYSSLTPGSDYGWDISYGATQMGELGNEVTLAGGGGPLADVVVAMHNWAATTATGPLTLNIYKVGSGNSLGSLITSATQTFTLPASPDGGTTPSNYNATFDFTGKGIVLPSEVIYGVVNDSNEDAGSSNMGSVNINLSLETAQLPVGSDTVPYTAWTALDPTASYNGVGGPGGYPTNPAQYAAGQVTCTSFALNATFASYSTATNGTWTGPNADFGASGGPTYCGMGPFVPAVEFLGS